MDNRLSEGTNSETKSETITGMVDRNGVNSINPTTSKVETTSALGRKIIVSVPAEVVQRAFDKVFLDIQKQVEIKGFRKGKAPLPTVRSMYKGRVMGDVASELINRYYFDALRTHNLMPVGDPEIEFNDPSEISHFEFSAFVEVRPEIELKFYEGLDLQREKFSVKDENVEKVLENIQNSRATLEPVLENRAIAFGETATIDFDGRVNGNPLPGGQGQNHDLEIGSKSFIVGFEEGLIGMKVDEERTLNLQFPTPYHAKELEGQPVEFVVKLRGIKRKVLPELTEEFLKSLGGPGDIESLKKSIREDIEQSEKKRLDDDFKNRLIKTLVKNNPVEVPKVLLNSQKKALVEDFAERMKQQGMNESDFTDYAEKWDSDFEATAREMVQASFLISTISEKHGLEFKEEDFEQKLNEYAAQTGIDLARLNEFYGADERKNRLAYTIMEEKVLAYLTAKAKVTEVEQIAKA